MSTPQVKETWKQKLFSSKGRINRLNYLLYNIALQIVASIAQFIFITALAFIDEDSAIIGVILFILTSVSSNSDKSCLIISIAFPKVSCIASPHL